MFSIQLNENRHNLLIGVVMFIVAILFLLYMGSAMVSSTKAFWAFEQDKLCRRNTALRNELIDSLTMDFSIVREYFFPS